MNSNHQSHGFTLIEVLIALAIIAIALTALLKATSTGIQQAQRLQNKTIQHWVAMQAVNALQLNLIQATHQDMSEKTVLFGQTWYWRAHFQPSGIPHIGKISIRTSEQLSGPFQDELIAFRYIP